MPVRSVGDHSIRSCTTFRKLIERSQAHDPDAFQMLLKVIQPDIRAIIGRALNGHRHLIDETISDAQIRLFIQLDHFQVDPSWMETDWERNFRRWSSKLVRNYAANVRRYGLDRARDWLFPADDPEQRQRARRRPQLVCMGDEDALAAIQNIRR